MLKAVGKHGLAALQNEKVRPPCSTPPRTRLTRLLQPHSAVTAWVDRLCLPQFEEDDYEGIPELVESINLQQTTGCVE